MLIQKAHAQGSVHLRPDGRSCAYLGAPPICTKCGSLLEPISSSPPSSEKERPVSNREVPGSSPGEGSTFPEALRHYVVVRRELTGGALLAQVVHAAGESAAAFAMNTGRHLPNDVRAVVLVATKEQMQAIISEHLNRSDTQFFPIVETDGPLAGSTTAIGFTPTTKEHLAPVLGHLRPWRAA